MRKSVIAAMVVSVALLAGAGVLFSEPMGPDGLPNIGGSWIGKVKVKSFDMSGEDDDWKGKEFVDVKVFQKGPGLEVQIFVDDGPRLEMSGIIGDGHFWLSGETESGPLIWVGHVKSKGKKLVGKLLGGEDHYALELSIQLKRPKEEQMR